MHPPILPLLFPLVIVVGLAGPALFSSSPIRQSRAASATEAPRVRAVSWNEAAPLVERLASVLPASLRDIPPDARPARWASWVTAERSSIAARIEQGEADSLVNLLLFGTSFTNQPRITTKLLADLDRRWSAGDRSTQETLAGAYRQRSIDLVNAASRPGAGERMRSARAILEQRGHDLATAKGRGAASDYLLDQVIRVRKEASALASALETARGARDAEAAIERRHLFRARGLAPDSSVLTQFAVDRALCSLRQQGTVAPLALVRIAILGPGLDFADKEEGFDFYDPQSIQPFTTIDTLLGCGLAPAAGMELTTIDVSARVNALLRGAARRASGESRAYRIVLPWDSGADWTDEAIAYWRRAGMHIGTAFTVSTPPLLRGIRARGVAIRPDAASRLRVVDANIVFDRLELPHDERFDLLIATNVLLYYDSFQQTMALASAAAMLRPGGLLLTNSTVWEVAEVPLRAAGSLTVRFSARQGDGEHMVWYRRE